MTTTPKGSDGEQETFFKANEPTGSSLLQDDARLESTASHQTARVPHPVFAIVNPPKVSSMARAALVEWLKLRKEYEEYTKDRCKDGKEDVSAVMTSVKSSFDASVLETLSGVCWGVDQSTVTDEFLLEKIHDITDNFQNQELPDVKELFREKLRMNMNNTDIDARVMSTFICNKVQNEQDYRVPEVKSDIRKLYELVRVKAKEPAIEERALKKANPARKKNERKEQKSSGNHQNKRRAEQNDNRMVKKVKQKKDLDWSQQKGGRSERSATKGAPKEAADINEDEFDDADEPAIGDSGQHEEDVRTGILELVETAIADGFPREYKKILAPFALRLDLWMIQLGTDPPAKVPPMKIRLKPGAKPYRCKARKYPPEVRRFMEDFNAKLVELGWVYENRESRWACPALPVRKGGGEFRQTADYKPMNTLVEAIVGVMPDLQTDLEAVKGPNFFGLFDFIKGYWQIALAEECQEMLS
ncbi:hypothetical protein F444_20525 [Phytophthora nicotianae P1976]|uniref:Reverse transcriptase domain-containing protein n=1 Tax=Phytophthora nicotianae P1976 TaxID=1317066 RepID=A0A080Z499_PHYNI|nr:hypothetical protein F444_20525 [Phytophthora nicotianae P1976]